MHYLIIAVLAFALSVLGCEGKTGPAGPTGPSGAAGPAGPAGPQGSTGPAGPAGADGADGAQGPAGPAGPQGPAGADGADGAQGPAGPAGPQGEQGPAGIPDTGGIDPIELAQAHHIAFVIDDADADMAPSTLILRVGEESMISAVVGAQSGKKLPSVSGTVAMAITKDESEAATLEDGMLTAVAAGTVEITATSELAGLTGMLTVTITKPVTKIVFSSASELNLAANESSGEITAMAHNEDDEVVAVRTNWDWESDDPSVASVAQTKVDKKLVEMGAKATITGKSSGSATVTATVEGVSGEISVSVTGQSITRVIDPSASSRGNVFVWDIGLATAAWTDAGAPQTGTVFTVNLRDRVSNSLIDNWSLAVTPTTATAGEAAVADPATAQVDPVLGASMSGSPAGTTETGAVDVTIAPVATLADGIAVGTYHTFVSLTATGAREARLQFTIRVIDSTPDD